MLRRSAWCCEYYAEWKGHMGRRRSSCCHVLPGAGLILKTSQHCTIFHVKWSCFTLDAHKISNQKTFLQANVPTFRARALWSQALTAFQGLRGEAFRFIQSWMSNKFTAVSQTWATHSPWLPEEINLLQFPRKPRSPNNQSDNQFYLAPSLSHTGFGYRRETTAFSKHVITYLSAYFKWR